MPEKIEQVKFEQSIEPLDPASVGKVKLASGVEMPVAAFGTFHSDWAQDYMKDATVEAIRLGWRHLDTARAYENEDVVGTGTSFMLAAAAANAPRAAACRMIEAMCPTPKISTTAPPPPCATCRPARSDTPSEASR